MQTALVHAKPGPVPTVVPPPITSQTADVCAKPVPLLLFGRDTNGRAHAACFLEQDAAVVEQTADRMDLFFIAAEGNDLCDLAAQLAVGRIFPASGKALVPFCSGKIYEQLLAAAGIADAPSALKAASKPAEGGGGTGTSHGGAGGSGAGDPPAKPAVAKIAGGWANLKIGSVVLAEDEDEGGFFPAKVVATKADDALQLVWTGYPDLPEFSRARHSLGLLHPDAVEAAE